MHQPLGNWEQDSSDAPTPRQLAVAHMLLIAGLIGCVSLLYATAGQAGGTAFLAVMAFAAFPESEMRPTALLLNIVAAGFATWRLHQRGVIDWGLVLPVTVPSMVTAFIGGLFVLGGRAYFVLAGLLLVAAAGVMLLRRSADNVAPRQIDRLAASLVGAGAGLLSGLTGVGGGVFLTPALLTLGWASPKRAAALSPAFILCKSIFGFIAVLLSGQRVAPGTTFYAVGALAGAIVGTSTGLRWMSEQATRYVLAVILLFAGFRLLLR
jgi:uncharacterized membrane protein YfcA